MIERRIERVARRINIDFLLFDVLLIIFQALFITAHDVECIRFATAQKKKERDREKRQIIYKSNGH